MARMCVQGFNKIPGYLLPATIHINDDGKEIQLLSRRLPLRPKNKTTQESSRGERETESGTVKIWK